MECASAHNTTHELMQYQLRDIEAKWNNQIIPPEMKESKFVVVSPVPAYNMYRIYKRHYYVAGCLQGSIAPGFLFDGASIPRLFWSMLTTPYNPEVLRAAAIHDHLYRTHMVSKKVADRKFRAVLIEDGVDYDDALKMYTAVRFGGHSAYKFGPEKALVGPWDDIREN